MEWQTAFPMSVSTLWMVYVCVYEVPSRTPVHDLEAEFNPFFSKFECPL